MDRQHFDVDGQRWVIKSYDYLENTRDGHSKFYRAARVVGPLGEYEFVQWGRIGQDTLTAQRQVWPCAAWPARGRISEKLAEKLSKGYERTVDTEVPRLAWVAIVASIKASRMGTLCPDWVHQDVPEVPRK